MIQDNSYEEIDLSPRDTAFDQLMLKRIHGILLICSNYDAFLLEEDGRIDEQLYNECSTLNLNVIPTFYHADSAEEAFKVLENENIELVIEMLNINGADSFILSHRIKEKHPNLPVVILTNFSREVSIKLQNEDLSAIDYVFCWLGNADLLLAIFKLIEDIINVENDVEVGVQTILLVEDSIRYTSIYLPFLYKIIFTQSMECMNEGLNQHQKLMRLRGRPKLLLARNYSEAVSLYNKYKASMLGVISDVKYKRNSNSSHKSECGLDLCRLIKSEFPEMPVILQSSDDIYNNIAPQYNVGFVNKFDRDLLPKLRQSILDDFCFGPFLFKDPITGTIIDKAEDLFSLYNVLSTIPDDSLSYHVSHHQISKWLNARGLFALGKLFRSKTREDFDSTPEIREYLLQGIEVYRSRIGQGIIAQYEAHRFDKHIRFSKVGKSSIGGKARGLAFADTLIKKYKLNEKYPGISLHIPITVAIGTDLFDEFMLINDLYKIALSDADDQTIFEAFQKARMPQTLDIELGNISMSMTHPIAIRSSSKLEDSYYEPFAGIYATYMIPCSANAEVNKQALIKGIKAVYASVFYQNSKSYMKSTSNELVDEKMGVVIQEICGKQHDKFYYPTISGVAKSINFYPIGEEKPFDGVAYLAFGFGRYIVGGSSCLQFSPAHPKKALPFVDQMMAVRNSQKYFYALDNTECFKPEVDEELNLVKLPVKVAESHGTLNYISSTWDYRTQSLREGMYAEGKKIITFANILKRQSIPLAEVIKDLLDIGTKEFGNPVEIEFAVDINTKQGIHALFHFLQIRPILHTEQDSSIEIGAVDKEDTIILSHKTMGNGVITDIQDMVYVLHDKFNVLETRQIAEEVGRINAYLSQENKNYVLVGPGRWGTSDDTLGIPVAWHQINAARIIVEQDIPSLRTESSQGTHFFQNLTSFRIGYFCVESNNNDICNYDIISKQTLITKTEHVIHVHFEQPLTIKIDGTHGLGVVAFS